MNCCGASNKADGSDFAGGRFKSSNPLMVALVPLIHILSSANVFRFAASDSDLDRGCVYQLVLDGYDSRVGHGLWCACCSVKLCHVSSALARWP